MTRVGVVTLARGRHEHLALQHRSLSVGSRLPDDYLVVAMGDPHIEPRTVGGLALDVVRVPLVGGELPLAAARNRGVREVIGRGVDVVVLLDVDCLAGEDLVAAYAEVVTAHPATIWSGPVTYLPPPPPGATPPPTRGRWRCSTRRTRRVPRPSRESCCRQRIRLSSGRCRSPSPRTRGDAPAGSARTTWDTAPRTPTSPWRHARPMSAWPGSVRRGPTTSTTRSARRRWNTSTPSCATERCITGGGVGGPCRAGWRASSGAASSVAWTTGGRRTSVEARRGESPQA